MSRALGKAPCRSRSSRVDIDKLFHEGPKASKSRLLPRFSSDFEQVGLLVWEADLALLVEASFQAVVKQSA